MQTQKIELSLQFYFYRLTSSCAECLVFSCQYRIVFFYRIVSCVEPGVAPDKVGFLQHWNQLMDELDNLLLVVEKFTKRKYLKRLNKKLDISSSPNFERLEVKIAMQKLI